MQREDIINSLTEILEKNAPLDQSTRSAIVDYRFLESAHIDSFSLMGFIIDIEDTFNIQLTPEDTQSEEFRTVGGIADLIEIKNVE